MRETKQLKIVLLDNSPESLATYLEGLTAILEFISEMDTLEEACEALARSAIGLCEKREEIFNGHIGYINSDEIDSAVEKARAIRKEKYDS